MYINNRSQIMVVEVDSSFALIDRKSGLIHIVDGDNLSRYYNGDDFECHSTEMVIAAKSKPCKPNKPCKPCHPVRPCSGSNVGFSSY